MQSDEYRFGYVSIVGRPNTGKSTLVNALLGQKVAAVSPKAQTTRRRQLGILTTEDFQMVFVDTPGLHKPRHKLGEFLNQEAQEALEGVDVVLFLVDVSVEPTDEDRWIAPRLGRLSQRTPLLLAGNKMDLLSAEALSARLEAYRALVPAGTQVIPISAVHGANLDMLQAALAAYLPPGPPQFDPQQVTDWYEREIAADLIREACLLNLRDEVPHGVAVRIDEFTERGEEGAYIVATVFVERESQKGILIGRGGVMLKRIGSAARAQIEAMSGRKVYLELRVKLLKEWRKDERAMKRVGYTLKNKKRR